MTTRDCRHDKTHHTPFDPHRVHARPRARRIARSYTVPHAALGGGVDEPEGAGRLGVAAREAAAKEGAHDHRHGLRERRPGVVAPRVREALPMLLLLLLPMPLLRRLLLSPPPPPLLLLPPLPPPLLDREEELTALTCERGRG